MRVPKVQYQIALRFAPVGAEVQKCQALLALLSLAQSPQNE